MFVRCSSSLKPLQEIHEWQFNAGERLPLLKLTEHKGNKGQLLSLIFYFSFILRILKLVLQYFVITENYLEMKTTMSI